MTEQTEGAEVAELADGFLASHLPWGTHADRWNDADWQRRFWTEVARTFLASGWYREQIAATEARGAERALREAADEFEAEDEAGRIVGRLRTLAALAACVDPSPSESGSTDPEVRQSADRTSSPSRVPGEET